MASEKVLYGSCGLSPDGFTGGDADIGNYPVNDLPSKHKKDYVNIVDNKSTPNNSEQLILILSFIWENTKTVAFFYGTLEELRIIQLK